MHRRYKLKPRGEYNNVDDIITDEQNKNVIEKLNKLKNFPQE